MKRTILILALCSAPAHALAGDAYVRSMKAKVTAEPRFDGKLVTTLDKGARVEVLGQQGTWTQVRAKPHEGWLPKLLLGDEPPMERVTLIQVEGRAVAEDARRRAGSATTAGAARGLTSEDRRRASTEFLTNYDAVRRIEGAQPAEGDAIRFLQDGLARQGG